MIAAEMKFVRNRIQLKVGIVIVSIALLVIAGLFFVVTNVYGIIGGTGPGTGCPSNDACTSAGTDWLKFSSASNNNPPNFVSFIKNDDGTRTQWADVATRCRAEGSNSVWVFVAYYNDRTPRSKGLNYTPSNATYYQNREASIATVKSNYDGANPDPQWVWGSNVAWFCYSDNPPWAVTVTSNSNKTIAEPGEKIIWTHRITNSGPNTTNRAVMWRSQDRGWSNAAGTLVWNLASGSGRNATASNSSEYTVSAADFGRQVCRSTYAAPANNLGGTTESAPACVTIGKKPKVQIHGGDLIVGRSFSDGAASNGTSIVETSQTVKLR